MNVNEVDGVQKMDPVSVVREVVVGYADPPGVEPQNQCLKNPTTTTLAPWRIYTSHILRRYIYTLR